jgi:hypothetical protein
MTGIELLNYFILPAAFAALGLVGTFLPVPRTRPQGPKANRTTGQ